MKSDRDDEIRLSPDDARFVEKLAETYAPERLTAEERIAFNAALEARLQERRRSARLVPALAGAVAAAAAAWLLLPGATPPPSEPRATAVVAGADASVPLEAGAMAAGATEAGAALELGAFDAVDWELELLDSDTLLDDDEGSAEDLLPDDYLAIASVFLDG